MKLYITSAATLPVVQGKTSVTSQDDGTKWNNLLFGMEVWGSTFDHEQTKMIGEPFGSSRSLLFLGHAKVFDSVLSFLSLSLMSLIHHTTFLFFVCSTNKQNFRPPLWSSGQSFWLQIQRSRVRFPALPDFSE